MVIVLDINWLPQISFRKLPQASATYVFFSDQNFCFRENPSATFRKLPQHMYFLKVSDFRFRRKLPQSFRKLPQHMNF